MFFKGIEIQDPRLLTENVSMMRKEEKIHKLMRVMGADWPVVDPDPSYELTMDNLLKILAIYMRLRADIPVIIMGETGCGKTRLCKYMCDLQINPRDKGRVKNMYLVKVHGGTSAEEIIDHVNKAEELALENSRRQKGMFTVLFFDEANSTEAIGVIKEVMCDKRVNGRSLKPNSGLKIIAACNPYKKHSDEAIRGFEQAGLGFYTDANEMQEKLGDLPMRHLVYRVQPLPASMLPIIWDFGQLNDQVERLYVAQIVKEKFTNLGLSPDQVNLVIELLSVSQKFMRTQRNECSFVSLRDVQRVLKVIQWFLLNGEVIFDEMEKLSSNKDQEKNPMGPEIEENADLNIQDVTEQKEEQEEKFFDEAEEQVELIIEPYERVPILEDLSLKYSIVLALNACYHVGLSNEDTRTEYRKRIASCFGDTHEDLIADIINQCYEVFLDEIDLPTAIARNQALKENVFMMLICIELKIPLFIIGKPGSSKSLAKTLIAQKMQGSDRTNSKILSHFKEAHLITFQCSPLSTSAMILKTFRYCAKYQLERRNDLDRYTSVVVLDEIGLAEASQSMPLKTLHPLLEDGVYFEEEEETQFINQLKRNRKNPNLEVS